MKNHRTLPIVITVLALVGQQSRELHAQSSYKEVEVSDGGTVRGVVRLTGEAPRRMLMVVSKDEKYCGTGKPSPRLSVSATGGIRNAIVWLEDISEGKRQTRTTKQVVLDQSRCEYTPHITLLPAGASLDIVNSDPVLHNVHTYAEGDYAKTVFNIAQPIRGQRTTVKYTQFRKHGIYLATCDAGHAWMNAYIMVTLHPYYVLTDAKGQFVLDDVPPGKYKLRMWHEGVMVIKTEMERGKPKSYRYEEPYEQAQEVTVPGGGSVTVGFAMALRSMQPGSVSSSTIQ